MSAQDEPFNKDWVSDSNVEEVAGGTARRRSVVEVAPMNCLVYDKREAIAVMAVLVAVVQASSITKAAITLGIPQSHASKLLARLEQRLGVQLLQRTTRTMQLTDIGKLYYKRACRLLAEIERLERDVEDHNRHPHGRIAVTAPTGLGEHLLMPMVVAFQQSYPDVTVEVDLSDRVVDLGTEEFDLAIRLTDQPPESCVAFKLAPESRVLCASPEYLQKHGSPDHPTDLARHRCINFITPNSPSRWYLRREIDGPGMGRAGAVCE